MEISNSNSDNDDVPVREVNARPCATSDEGALRQHGVRRSKTTSSPTSGTLTSTTAAINDVTVQVMAARVASLEARLTAMDNLQELLSAKSAQLTECAARLRETETERRAAERRWEIAVRRQLTARSGQKDTDGAATAAAAAGGGGEDGRGIRVVDGIFRYLRSPIASAKTVEVVSDSSSSGDGTQVKDVKDGNSFGSCADGCGDHERSRAKRTLVTSGVVCAPETEAGRTSACDVNAANSGPRQKDVFPFRVVVGRGTGPSIDLVEKLMRQNARLKETIRQMVERRYRMTVSEYLVSLYYYYYYYYYYQS